MIVKGNLSSLHCYTCTWRVHQQERVVPTLRFRQCGSQMKSMSKRRFRRCRSKRKGLSQRCFREYFSERKGSSQNRSCWWSSKKGSSWHNVRWCGKQSKRVCPDIVFVGVVPGQSTVTAQFPRVCAKHNAVSKTQCPKVWVSRNRSVSVSVAPREQGLSQPLFPLVSFQERTCVAQSFPQVWPSEEGCVITPFTEVSLPEKRFVQTAFSYVWLQEQRCDVI